VHEIDLDAYFARIGYSGFSSPTLETLRHLAVLHPTSIAFENLDPLMKRPVRLDLPSLEQKLVNELRGGYCYEHNTLFEAVLRQLGFLVSSHAARVQWNASDGQVRARTHMVLRVDLPEGPHIADTGFGLLTLTAPLRLQADVEQATPHGLHRFVRVGEDYELEVKLVNGWAPIYQLSLHEQAPADWEVANWFTSTHPRSIFTNSLMAARPAGDLRYALLNYTLKIYHPDGNIDRHTVGTLPELASTLENYFRILLPNGHDEIFLGLMNR